MKQGIAEILQEVSSKKTKKERVEELKKHSNNLALRTILVYAFHPEVEFLLPKGDAPYTPQDKAMDLQAMLYPRTRKLGMFIKNGGYDHLTKMKREALFVQLLESIDPDDAKLMVAVKDKKMPYKGITKDTIEKAWPGFTDSWSKDDGNKTKSNG